MIHHAMTAIVEDVNASFRARRGDSVDTVILSSLSGGQDASSPASENKVFLFLTRIYEEHNVSTSSMRKTPNGAFQHVGEPAFLNLHIVLAAVFKHYPTGLQVLSDVIGYLNGKLVFTRENTPSMAPGLERFILKMVTLDYSQQSLLWGTLGAKYYPSVMYSMRLLTVGDPQIKSTLPAISRPDYSGVPA